MNPQQANWDGEEGQTHLLEPTIRCEPSGTITFESGDYKFETTDPSEASQMFTGLIQYGLDHAQGQS